jgi:NADH pyrophosphatase NudC (nudix superfamily)
MIGCFAESEATDIQVDGNEIVAARWFDRTNVKRLINGDSDEVGLPRADAIALHLIRHWAEER